MFGRPHWKLAVNGAATGLPLRGAAEAVSRMGVHGIQLDAAGELLPDRLSDTARREVRTTLKGYNLELAALYAPLRRGLDISEDLQPRIEYLHKIMQLSADLGPRMLVVPCPALPDGMLSTRALTMNEALLDLGKFGDKIGVTLALEIGIDPTAKVLEYLNKYDTGSLRLAYDPANFMLNRHDVFANLGAMGNRLAYIQARDARANTASGMAKELPVGAGDIDWTAFVATLESLSYRGFVTIDREEGNQRTADLAVGVGVLRRFVRPEEN